MKIPFNKPYLTGKENDYFVQAVQSGHISGNGLFTKKCQQFLEQYCGVDKTLLTTSCTDALEMSALLLDIQPGDEVIMPSFTFVSSANAFLLRGAKIKFADSYPHHPNVDPAAIEILITPRTKVIVVVHYAGVACDMDAIMKISKNNQLAVVEDAAQAIASNYKNKPLGSIGDFGAYSFHETKNIISGEGGALLINNKKVGEQAEIIWEKGTNRAAFFRGELDKYEWKAVGSSFLPSELTASFLYAQLENIETIQHKRKAIWMRYFKAFEQLEITKKITRPIIPSYATNNGHLFYLVCNSKEQRTQLIDYLASKDILAVFHYLPLHKSQYFKEQYQGDELVHCTHFSECLVRLPLYYDLTNVEQEKIIGCVNEFYSINKTT